MKNLQKKIDNASLLKEFNDDGVSCYQFNGDFDNQYFVVSESGTRNLMNKPEIVGLEVCKRSIKSTTKMIEFLHSKDKIHNCNILTILRGGLNYPIEQCCHNAKIAVPNMSFVSCEREFDDQGIPNGLVEKYNKIAISNNSTIMIGDIVASGDTLKYCINDLVDQYRQANAKLKNIVIFTIGGTRAIKLAEDLSNTIREIWSDFKGITVIFYEGIFSCYEPGDFGAAGVNTPLIDFIWRNGVIAPEFRQQTLSSITPLFEKCIIYDGGARRYQINDHIEEVLEFWNSIYKRADTIDIQKLTEEKLGHPLNIDYGEWVKSCHYQQLDERICSALFTQEQKFLKKLSNTSLKKIAENRIREFKNNVTLAVAEN